MRGGVAAVACYVYWGLIIFYWKLLGAVSSEELLMHRVVWTLGLVLVLMRLRGGLGEYGKAFRSGRTLLWQSMAAALMAGNWYLFVYGVTNDRITDASLGYYLCPFVTVFWGRVAEKEELNRFQWMAIALAALGVGRLAFNLDDFPYVAVGIALTWGTFNIVKKRSPLGIFSGLGVEMSLLTPFALAWLLWHGGRGEIVWGTLGTSFDWLIASTGVVTVIPLLLYSYAVKRVSLTSIGLLQFLMPTMGLAIAVFIYDEPFGSDRFFAFGCIWLSLVLYGVDMIARQRRERRSRKAKA